MNISEYKIFYEARLQIRKSLFAQKENKEKDLEIFEEQRADLIKARWTLTEVARQTQENFKARVEKLVTMAIRAVFVHRDFKFLLIFEEKRNQLECQMLVQEGDYEPEEPKDEMGGGIVDIISFALRVVFWSMSDPSRRNCFTLDEPGKNIGRGDMLIRMGKMFWEISHRLNLQLIIVTHEPRLAELADKAYHVVHDGGNSIVSLLKDDIRQEGAGAGSEDKMAVKPKRQRLKRRK